MVNIKMYTPVQYAKIFVQLFGRLALTGALKGCKNSHSNLFSLMCLLNVASISSPFLSLFVSKYSQHTP